MDREIVIFLHGIGHSLLNMAMMEKTFRQAGYDTLNWFYPLGKWAIKDDHDGCVSVESTEPSLTFCKDGGV